MTRMIVSIPLVSAFLLGGFPSVAEAQTAVQQEHASGTITVGSTVCVGPLAPSSTAGVQIFGFTNATRALTWQVFQESSQSAPVLVFETTARSVDQTIPPTAGFLYRACVVKTAGGAEDFDLTLNSAPVG
jgi:hypothetical protein